MQVYIVEYTNEDCTGNQTLQMEIEAPDLETAYEIVDTNYPDLAIDTIYPLEDAYEYDGQPDEAQEWHDFDPDC
jgi:hypothetical protein